MDNNIEENGLNIQPLEASNTIFFIQEDGYKELIRICPNGDIFIKEKLMENDKELVDAFREFLKTQGYLI